MYIFYYKDFFSKKEIYIVSKCHLFLSVLEIDNVPLLKDISKIPIALDQKIPIRI